MKKLFVLFIAFAFILASCSKEQENKLSEAPNESDTDTETVTTTKANSLELIEIEEIDIFTKAVSNAKKLPGSVNIINPQYKFSIGEENYLLWITEDSGTIMNAKDTHTIYSLSSSSVEEIYEFVSKG